MKKIIMILMLLLALPAMAQNANRSGFYMELGVGALTGSTPVVKYTYSDGNLNAHFAGGLAGSFAMGVRSRTGRYTAFDIKLQAEAAKCAPGASLIAKLLPGLRITTPEIYRNMSIYIAINLGPAISTGTMDNSGEYEWYAMRAIETGEKQVSPFDGVAIGGAYAVGIGVNFSNHFYAGYSWDDQFMHKQMRESLGLRHWGMSSFRIGYKF